MSSARWQRLQSLFHETRDRPHSARAAFLDRACEQDAELRADVERLLAASDRAGSFINEQAILTEGLSFISDETRIGRQVGVFRLVRELGRGGMGAVYLGVRQDGAFAQQVAIKLIKRGMDTQQVLTRFRAERQIMASLDHPHIARLLDGGTTTDGLPYFAMEYIEGQPLDTYCETAQLGIDDRLRLFLQVCDAVAYAHSKGVIHRDIKPLNTLVTSAGVPKLLDFGIAKVLHDAPDENTATVTGLRLLTPDYASPEQIEGRGATVTSDVYSLGVLLYELLTGRSPYRVQSRSPQEIAQAVCTAEPDRPSAVVTQSIDRSMARRAAPTSGLNTADATQARHLSRQLRGDLDTIVLTALRKAPARRYASVSRLAGDIRRYLERQPIVARGDHLGYRAMMFARRNGAALIGTASLTVLAVAGILVDRSRQTEPTLISTRSLGLRDRIIVADFADRTGDNHLAAAITEAFQTDIAQSAVIRVMTPRQVRSSLATMLQSSDAALNDSLARELAVREGVKAIVTGSVSQVSGVYSVNVQLIAAQSGEALVVLRETANDSTHIIAAVDRASKRLRRAIGESLQDLKEMPSLQQATTASLPALRLYSEAQRLVRSGDRTAAIAHFERSISLDTGFASAHLGLSMVYGSMGDEGRTQEAIERALVHQQRLPFLERSFLIGSRAYFQQDYSAAVRTYSSVVERFPENVPALNNLALAHRDARNYVAAESLFRRGAGLDTNIANLLFGLHSAHVLQGEFPDAAAVLDTLRRRFPGHPVYLTEAMQDAAAQHDWSRAEQMAWAQIEDVGTDTAQLVDPYEALAQIAMVRGRLAEAESLWASHSKVSRASSSMSRHLFGVVQRGHLFLRYHGDTARAVAWVDSSLRATPLDSLLRADRRYDEVARFYLAAGRRDRVHALLSAAELNDRAMQRPQLAERWWTRGLAALADGRVNAAIDTLRLASARHVCPSCVLPDLGRALQRGERLREAADVYQRYLTTPWLWRYEPDAVELGWTMRRLAEISEQIGDRERARAIRSQLLELYQDADSAVRSPPRATGRNGRFAVRIMSLQIR